MKNWTRGALLALPITTFALPSLADEIASISPEAFQGLIDNSSALRIGIDTVWVLVTAMLVFWMNAGFALVESGLCRAKNTSNILAKNFIVFAASSISFWVIGWGLMFGDGNALRRHQGLFFVGGADNSPALGEAYAAMNPFSTTIYEGVYSAINWTPVPLWAKFFFQLVFAGTAATIVSGAVAERIKFGSFLVFSFLLVAFVYPITGHWIWGGGLLGAQQLPRLRRLDRRALGRRLGGARGRDRARSAHRQVRQGRQGEPDPGSQHDVGRARRADPLARLVRVQPGLDDGRDERQRDRAHPGDHQHGRRDRRARRDVHRLAAARQAGSLDDPERLPRRAWSRSPRPARS